jgi:hypothetical protein
MTEETLFAQAIELSPTERAAFLDRECPDPGLRGRVEVLLAADAQLRSPMDAAWDQTRLLEVSNATEEPLLSVPTEGGEGVVIAGRYKLRQQIGGP